MSDIGSLANCLMDSDTEELERSRRLRRDALIASLILEAALIAAMLLWPLLTPAVISHQYSWNPLPPYHGGGSTRPAHSPGATHHPVSPNKPHHPGSVAYQPPTIPGHLPQPMAPEEPSFNDDSYSGPGLGIPGVGPFIPGGGDDNPGPRINIEPPHVRHHDTTMKISEGVMQASLIHPVQPIYPPSAIALHLSGTVILRATIATDGTVQKLQVLSGNPVLARAAVDAVWQWRYRPTLLSGEPVEVETYITVNFVLQ